ncbi:TlpA family protein disulfide reductase [Penaeicola halotolerans]|uniref:TlpA family protein disulfide reductase n=1 Tax=Penaeicola halotolerans TaxID=2793196 RepID=UPI001CF91894|nr:TlpA disulfide reductase family protein [Penaeicola halotolerans]
MKKINSILVFGFLVLMMSATSLVKDVPVIKWSKMEQLIQAEGDQIRVINFWATWCRPCIAEMPLFEAVNAQEGVEVVFISLDNASDVDPRVTGFITKRNIQSQVYLLDEVDYNKWIDKVSPEWSGAIPASLFINQKTGEKVFHEGELKETELQEIIDKLSNS